MTIPIQGAIPHPLVVLWRRIRWKIHWKLQPGRPFVIDPWWDGMTLVLPQSGSAAIAYYRTFGDEAIARWMVETLHPGMAVIDVGAHVGVYSFLAARLVTEEGVVHAIEPQEGLLSLLAHNAELNGLLNVKSHCLALGDADGRTALCIDPRSMGAFTRPVEHEDLAAVQSATLQAFARTQQLRSIGLMKLDAAGNELAVLRGGQSLLEEGRIVRIICKLYHPDVVAGRFGEDGGGPQAIAEFLRRCAYSVVLPDGTTADGERLDELFAEGTYSVPALATRQGGLSRVDERPE